VIIPAYKERKEFVVPAISVPKEALVAENSEQKIIA
jgi:hypothetical protein